MKMIHHRMVRGKAKELDWAKISMPNIGLLNMQKKKSSLLRELGTEKYILALFCVDKSAKM